VCELPGLSEKGGLQPFCVSSNLYVSFYRGGATANAEVWRDTGCKKRNIATLGHLQQPACAASTFETPQFVPG